MNTYGYVGGNPSKWADPNGLKVMIVGHMAGGALGRVTNPNSYHLALYLDPDDKCECKGNWPMTVGGQFAPYSGTLVSAYNYPGDSLANATHQQIVPTPAGMSDCDFIKSILRGTFKYPSNTEYSFPEISPVPGRSDGSMPPGSYNSNSYVSGALTAAGAAPPTINTGGAFQVPGYSNPLPMH